MDENKVYPRVLVVSHNMFGYTGNMRKTLNNMFNGWDKDKIAQISFLSELPESDICDNYYRITDFDVMKSAITRKPCGRKLDNEYISKLKADLDTGSGKGSIISRIYGSINKKASFWSYLRNKAWKLCKWNSASLNEWLDEFAPECVFFASGDYSFSYIVAHTIAKIRNIPLIVYCCDDYYINAFNNRGWLAKRNRKEFMAVVNDTIAYSSAIVTICDKMTADYKKLFDEENIYTLNTNAEIILKEKQKTNRISYIGNVSLGRAEQLADIGKALHEIDAENKPDYIDVYSATTDEEKLSLLSHDNGIDFKGKLDRNGVMDTIAGSMAVIHTESFDEALVKRVMYSVSTKIPDSLASGTCIIAYGPKKVASMEYLANNDAACVINSKDELKARLKEIIENEDLRRHYEENAVKLADKNHNVDENRELLRNIIINVTGDMGS